MNSLMKMGFSILLIFCLASICEAESNSFCQFVSRWFGYSNIYTPNMSDVHSVTKKAIEDAKREMETVEKTADKIGPLVGRCVLDPPNEVSEGHLKGPINYDSLVLPYMTGAKFFTSKSDKMNSAELEAPLILQARDLDIPGLNAHSLVEIDSLSRTIYAEMAKCAPIGNEYLLAIARVIKNRAKAVETKRGEIMTKNPKASHKSLLNAGKEFITYEDQHWPGKDTTSKVSSSPVQFSAWNSYVIDFNALDGARKAEIKRLSKKMSAAQARKKAEEDIKPDAKTHQFYKFNESGLLQTLCPPSNKTKKFYTGGKPSESMQAIWRSTVQVAVEAVLYPKQFSARTRQLSKVLNYTSDRQEFYDFEQVYPRIDGRKIDNNTCLNLWVNTNK